MLESVPTSGQLFLPDRRATANPQAALRLFCFPYAGGSAQIYRQWPASLPAAVEVCPVQLPGRGNRLLEPPFTTMAEVVAYLSDAVGPFLDKPFAFFGHSMGAVISFELARSLRRARGVEPRHLFVSGRRAPQLPRTRPPIHQLPAPELIEELRRLNGTPREVLANAELMQLMLPVIRADFAVVSSFRYTAEPPLGCPITALGGLQDEDVPREHLEAWREQTSAACTVRMFAGDHFFLQSAEPLLLRVLARDLQQLAANLG
ncbi:MAG: thioesterase [Acidobacteria bacterium]|nr:thioesterase [Acidobacteriota bacterium]